MTKAIVVGRHAGEIPGVEVIEQRAVTFPATAKECQPVIDGLVADAVKRDAIVLFQNTPGQVAVALAHRTALGGKMHCGVVISKPGERLAGVERKFQTEDGDVVAEAVKFANPRATVADGDGFVAVQCDPPMKFEFSHIEWF